MTPFEQGYYRTLKMAGFRNVPRALREVAEEVVDIPSSAALHLPYLRHGMHPGRVLENATNLPRIREAARGVGSEVASGARNLAEIPGRLRDAPRGALTPGNAYDTRAYLKHILGA